MSSQHFRTKSIEWWKREGSTPHSTFVHSAIGNPAIQRVLEIGPGRGAMTFSMRDVGKHVVAVEINPAFIEFCRKRDKDSKVSFVCGSGLALPFRKESFDAVVCIEVFMHLPEPSLALREIARVARPNGCVVISYLRKYSRYHFRRIVSLMTGIYRRRHGPGAFDYRYDSLRDFRHYALGTTLELQEVNVSHPENPCIVFRKSQGR